MEWMKSARRHWAICLNGFLFSVILALLLYDVSHSEDGDPRIEDISGRLQTLEKRVRTRRSVPGRPIMAGPVGGAVYTRWGRSVCPEDADLVYAGFAAGTLYTHAGGGAEPICLTDEPEWGEYNDGANAKSQLYGAEYELYAASSSFPFSTENLERATAHDEDIPCAVCQSTTRREHLMIPGRLSCYPGWQKEYSGYLMAGHHGHKRIAFTCIDGAPEGIQGGLGNQNGMLFYNVEGVCGSLPCPPYINYREITCVVCTK